MGERTYFNNNSEDKQIFRLLNSLPDGETNSEIRMLAMKSMRKVIENQLSARQREYIMLYYYKGFDMPTIAQMLCVTPSTVSRTLMRARRNIMKYLQYYFD